MKKEKIALAQIKLIGITARTNNTSEANPSTAKISPTVQHYFQGNLPEKILHRKNPGVTFCAYTEYESDFRGEYTFFIGEEVDSFDDLPEGFKALTIEAQSYVKFTTEPGPMPGVVIQAWQDIWRMNVDDFGGHRRYHADFERYDERAADPQNAVVDIYIGSKEVS
jgi:predicted transcriptional regulator YdeE